MIKYWQLFSLEALRWKLFEIPVAHLQRTEGVKCSYLEIDYPQPCDFQGDNPDGIREDGLEVKVRIVTDLPTKERSKIRYTLNLKLPMKLHFILGYNRTCSKWE